MWYDIIASDLFLLTLTVGLYCVGMRLYRRVHTPLLHPVLLTFIAVIVFLRCTGIDYPRYQEATSILNFVLGMSVVALGYLMYEQIDQLRGRLIPVIISTLACCVVGVLSVVYIAMAFGAERAIVNSLAPKSVTVPIAVSVAGPRWWSSAWASSAASSESGFSAGAALPTPRPAALRWARRPTASARRAPSKSEPSRGPSAVWPWR